MAQVTVQIGGRGHQVACRDGEETRVAELALAIEERWPAASRAAGGTGERAMFFVALMLADALDDARNRPPEPGLVGEDTLHRIADRLETLAKALEQAAPAA